MNQPLPGVSRTVMICFLLGLFCASGCATLRERKIVSDSIVACRHLSRDGVAAMELGQWDSAHELLLEAVQTSPTDIDARRHLAEVLWQREEQRDAVVHLEAAVRLDPRHAPTVVRSGEMLLGVGAVDRALKRAEEAIALDPALAGAWALRGRVYRRQGDSVRALADLQQALRYSPHTTEILLETAEIQHTLGRPQRSLTTLHHLLDVYPPGEEPQRVLWLEGLVYRALDRRADAVESLFAASLRGQPDAELLYHLAEAQKSSGQPGAAASSLRQALALDAGHEASQLLLAQMQGNLSPALGEVIRR